VAQNITSAAYKGVGGWMGWSGLGGGGLRLPSDTMGPVVVPMSHQ